MGRGDGCALRQARLSLCSPWKSGFLSLDREVWRELESDTPGFEAPPLTLLCRHRSSLDLSFFISERG